VYNIGGGPDSTISIWQEFHPMLEALSGHPIEATFADWRPGDQPVYVSDITKAKHELGWAPRVSMEQGVERLWRWVDANVDLFADESFTAAPAPRGVPIDLTAH
jgi:CDP-paratose 2-epimerase